MEDTMTGYVQRLRHDLTHVKTSAWHYRVVRQWGTPSEKACAYYWWDIPTSLFLYGMSYALLLLVWTSGWFFGFMPAFIRPKNDEATHLLGSKLIYPYKRNSRGERYRFAPWELALALVALAFLYYLIWVDPQMGTTVGLAAATLLVLGALGWAVRKFTRVVVRAREAARVAWDRVCPPLVIEREEA